MIATQQTRMPRHATELTPLTRKEFYALASHCRKYASHLACFDQHRVNLKECNRFNGWLRSLKQYDLLAPTLTALKPARPVARWQVMVIMIVMWLIMAMTLPGMLSRQMLTIVMASWLFTIVANLFIPEFVYGTTVELLEAKVLLIVDTLLELLNSGTMEFTEAAFFKAREDLLAAHTELRQQIDLAHR